MEAFNTYYLKMITHLIMLLTGTGAKETKANLESSLKILFLDFKNKILEIIRNGLICDLIF